MLALPLSDDSEREYSDVGPFEIHEWQTIKTNKKRKRKPKSPIKDINTQHEDIHNPWLYCFTNPLEIWIRVSLSHRQPYV